MNIVRASNYDDETYNEAFVEGLDFNPSQLQTVCNLLNNIDVHSQHYYKVVPAGYQLNKWEP